MGPNERRIGGFFLCAKVHDTARSPSRASWRAGAACGESIGRPMVIEHMFDVNKGAPRPRPKPKKGK